MADGAVAQQDGAVAAGEGAAEGQEQGYSFWPMAKGFMFRALMIYFITSLFRKGSTPTGGGDVTDPTAGVVRLPASNAYIDQTTMDLFVYLSTNDDVFDFPTHLLWRKRGLVYGDWTGGVDGDGCHYSSTSFPTTEQLRNNGSVYLRLYLVPTGQDPKPGSKRYQSDYTVHVAHRLNKYMKRHYKKTANLITGATEKSDEEIQKADTVKSELISHWHPNVTINLVHDFTQWIPGGVPAPLEPYIEFLPDQNKYKPILFVNTYWNLVRDYQPINSTTTSLNVSFTFQPLSLFKWQLYAAQSSKNKWGAASSLMEGLQPSDDEEDNDALKEAILETNPILLVLTVAVSILHSVFEFLAFKNDIQFWNNRQSLEGLSVRSVFFNVFQALIVLLYVCDNETNFVIKVSCFVGLAIELWKITKVKDVTVNYERRILGLPTLSFEDKGTYVESSTRTYDQMAFRYLGVALFPLLAAYCCYSLVYYEHKGWYSFVLSMLYGFLLTFGFIMMTPQLFINYKLKSVAHLPWRMLTYKALNTFIDDIFAFVIKMPTMYRLGCLRDDVIFFIFLYQRYIYRIDPTRMNEFGFSQEMERQAREKKEVDRASTGPAAIANGSEDSKKDGGKPPKPKSQIQKKKD
ncbi:Cleft lip and palate transmembrane 1 [Trinorchestia longiramus]|nr:Cleft lip and palate transmembrane 1 [Trinorchestia longiramus]